MMALEKWGVMGCEVLKSGWCHRWLWLGGKKMGSFLLGKVAHDILELMGIRQKTWWLEKDKIWHLANWCDGLDVFWHFLEKRAIGIGFKILRRAARTTRLTWSNTLITLRHNYPRSRESNASQGRNGHFFQLCLTSRHTRATLPIPNPLTRCPRLNRDIHEDSVIQLRNSFFVATFI